MLVGGIVSKSSKLVAGGRSALTLVSVSVLFLARPASAQQGLVINVTAATGAVENSPVVIMADMKSLTNISQALLFYRNDLSTDFQQTEMSFQESSMSLSGTVPSSYVISPYIEVYVRLMMRDGSIETYPTENPTENPVHISVRRSESEKDILIISPDRDQRLTVDNLMIAVSMLFAPKSVERQKTQLYFDGLDVTSDAVVSGQVIVYSPTKFPVPVSGGVHTAKVVLYDSSGARAASLEWHFYIIALGENQRPSFSYQGSGKIELSNETISGVSTWYNRGDLNLGGTGFGMNMGAIVHITSEEKSYRQPQDRFGLYASTSWLSLKLGDGYPAFSPLIMNGLRVRGVSGRLSLGFFKLEAAYGQTVRGINGQYLDTLVVAPGSGLQLTGANYIRLNDSTFINVNYGTYSRNMFAVRPSFDFGNHASLGFTFLKSSDVLSSINLGSNPNQNLVVGSDFSMNFDNRRINFLAEGAMSMLNQNTAVGNRSAAFIDSAAQSDIGTQINNIVPLTTLSSLITINEYLVPLDPTKLSSLAWDVSLSLNYLNTFAKVGYIYRGPDYTSFGQPFINTDVRGLNVFLRPRLFSNQVLLSISYENLFDNLQHQKVTTTNFVNSNVSLSYFPIASLPGLTLGYSSYYNTNSISPDSAYAVDNLTYRYYVESDYSFQCLGQQNLAVSVGISKRRDKVLLGTNINNSNVSLMLNSNFGVAPLKTSVGFNLNGNRSAMKDTTALALYEQIQTFNYTFITIGATYGLFHERLSVGANYTPTFGAFTRNGYGFIAILLVAKTQSIDLNINYFASTSSNDLIGSLVYAVDF